MSEQNKEIVRSYYDEVLNGRNLDAVGDYFADERMVEGVRRGCFSYFTAFPDLHVALDEFVAEDDRVFLRSTMTGTHDGEYRAFRPLVVMSQLKQRKSSASPTASSSATGA
jgi:predicted ester cyclase